MYVGAIYTSVVCQPQRAIDASVCVLCCFFLSFSLLCWVCSKASLQMRVCVFGGCPRLEVYIYI